MWLAGWPLWRSNFLPYEAAIVGCHNIIHIYIYIWRIVLADCRQPRAGGQIPKEERRLSATCGNAPRQKSWVFVTSEIPYFCRYNVATKCRTPLFAFREACFTSSSPEERRRRQTVEGFLSEVSAGDDVSRFQGVCSWRVFTVVAHVNAY